MRGCSEQWNTLLTCYTHRVSPGHGSPPPYTQNKEVLTEEQRVHSDKGHISVALSWMSMTKHKLYTQCWHSMLLLTVSGIQFSSSVLVSPARLQTSLTQMLHLHCKVCQLHTVSIWVRDRTSSGKRSRQSRREWTFEQHWITGRSRPRGCLPLWFFVHGMRQIISRGEQAGSSAGSHCES